MNQTLLTKLTKWPVKWIREKENNTGFEVTWNEIATYFNKNPNVDDMYSNQKSQIGWLDFFKDPYFLWDWCFVLRASCLQSSTLLLKSHLQSIVLLLLFLELWSWKLVVPASLKLQSSGIQSPK
jgi:hypothetical protein